MPRLGPRSQGLVMHGSNPELGPLVRWTLSLQKDRGCGQLFSLLFAHLLIQPTLPHLVNLSFNPQRIVAYVGWVY